MNIIEHRIILHRRHCEERQRYLAELESLAQRLRADRSRLRAEIERAVAVGNPASAQPVLERQAKLARSLAAIEGQIAAAGDALAAAARDLKRLELGAAQRADGAGPSDGRRPPRSSRARRAVPDRGG
jgi:phage shock protein A